VIPEFDGVFDGGGWAIENLAIVSGDFFLGLFGRLYDGAQVTNLRVVDANITHLEMGMAGILAARNDGLVANSYAGGTIAAGSEVGGLVGSNCGSVLCCFSAGNVGAIKGVGGLVGHNKGLVANSYSVAGVSGRVFVAGLVGDNDSTGIVSNSYSAGPVSDTHLDVNPPTPEGMGGLVGRNRGHVVNGFWDLAASGLSASDGGDGKTTAEMQTDATFLEAGWDFVCEAVNGAEDIWWMPEGGYPRLVWEVAEVPPCPGVVVELDETARRRPSWMTWPSRSGARRWSASWISTRHAASPKPTASRPSPP